ncbi:MAG TPA: hypothetical protein VGC66_09935 [Pyrinomonadaceae bacterium]|jgi:hypothetical protein
MKDQRKVKKERTVTKEKSAVGFEANPFYERLLELREQKPAAYNIMSAATRLAVEAYVKAKDSASGHVAAKAA